MNHTTHSLDSDSAVADTAGNISSRSSSSSRRRGPSRGSKPLPDGKKKKVKVNSWGQPILEVNSYSTTVGTLTRNHIPINYKKFTNIPDELIHIVKTKLELTFDLRCVANFSILRRINDAWKRHKSRLNKKYSIPPQFVPKEVWVEFVDMCNSDAFQAQSKKNTENRNKVKAPCTTGQTNMAVVRHNLAVERNVPDEDVGRADVFIKAHTKADKTYQCPEIITLGKDKKGHMIAMGIDITPSFVANAIHIVEENEDLKATNNELKTMLLNMRKDLDDHIKKTLGAPQIQPSSSYNAPSNSSHASQRKLSYLNRECKLNGCPEGIVAYGIVADVSLDTFCHNKQLGDGYYKIEIFNVINEDALLFRQDSFTKTMGDVEILGIEWFKKGYRPPDFEKEENVNLDDVNVVFNDSEEHLVTKKKEKSLIQDIEESISYSDRGSTYSLFALDTQEKQLQCSPIIMNHYSTDVTDNESGDVMRNIPGHLSDDLTMNNIKGKYDESVDDSSVDAKSNVDMKECVQHQDDHNIESGCRENSKLDMNGKHFEGKAAHFSGKTSSAMHVPDLRSLNGDSEKQQIPVVTCNSMAPQVPQVVGDTTSGTPTKASKSSVSNSDDFDEKEKLSIVQQRGRFKVTFENITLEKGIPSPMLQKFHSLQFCNEYVVPKDQLEFFEDITPQDIVCSQKASGVTLKEEDLAVCNVKINLTRGRRNPLERVKNFKDYDNEEMFSIADDRASHLLPVEVISEAFENFQLKTYGLKTQVHEMPEKKKCRRPFLPESNV
ncbi:hypothetical protein GIB67_028301 [Kingdonia uniflora]|uniref:Uncharacterized protein n=1 Tax=Kingdonia uniflora TaxID=39325 RepID=A0A7J7MHL5_9MAGN|nr:hypothetical protein GIB67_028301 [Kingdonia uniflora]